MDDKSYTHRQIVEILLQKEGITEGFWSLGINFGLSPINARNSEDPDAIYPSMIVSVAGFSLRKEAASAIGMVVDASKLGTQKKKAPTAKKTVTKSVGAKPKKNS